MSEDATATYRGYRRQALYALWRILSETDSSRIFRPEGQEDLAIYDGAQALLEVVQVKDFSSSLSLSDFKPDSPHGYFARMLARRRDGQRCRHVIVTYGPLGPELQGAIDGEEKHRLSVVRKLMAAQSSVNEQDASELLDALRGNVRRVDEAEMRGVIARFLEPTIAGGHVDGAIALLMFWMFDAAENKRDITRDLLEHQLERVGEYLAQLRDGSTEWMTSIVPVRDEILDDTETARLCDEYRKGVHATWKHIVANADLPRRQLLDEIHEKFQSHSVVIVRGASGQGKSSLAWRYLNEYTPDGLRFHVNFVADRAHAKRIAHVLRGHAKTLRLKAVVYVDVAPADTGWTELLQPLIEEQIRVLVTVREEDLTRARFSLDSALAADVALDRLSRDDAERIYARIAQGLGYQPTLKFEEAWSKFSAPDGGPLLEFTHLVSEGEALSKKVTGQILRLQLEAGSQKSLLTPAHLRLLSLCAVANAADCRIDLSRACSHVGLDPLVRPLALFENEYLLRVSDRGAASWVSPLHALRSRAIVAALLTEQPAAWIELAAVVLPLLVHADVELFLLSAFSQRGDCSKRLQEAIGELAQTTWVQAGGIAAALLWQGINSYESANRAVLSSAIAQYGGAWQLLADVTFGGEEAFRSLRETFERGGGRKIPTIALSSKQAILEPLRQWFAIVVPPSGTPKTSEDWRCAGNLAFWLGTTGVRSALRAPLLALLRGDVPENIALEDLAAFVSGQNVLDASGLALWHAANERELRRRYVTETESVHVHDDGKAVTVFFPVTISERHDYHEQALRRVTLLHRLFPHRSMYCSRGLGLEALEELNAHNPTIKDIPGKNLVDSRAIHLNATTLGLVAFRHRRLARWSEYVDSVLGFRRATVEALERLSDFWERLIAEQTVKPRTLSLFPSEALQPLAGMADIPMLPQSAVDEWGFISEGRTAAGDSSAVSRASWDQLVRFQPWISAYRKYWSSVHEVARRAEGLTVRVVTIRNKLPETVPTNDGHLLIVNLDTASQELTVMQRKFRDAFGVGGEAVRQLEQIEATVLRNIWLLAFALVNEPARRRKDATSHLLKDLASCREQFLLALAREASTAIPSGRVRVRENSYVDGQKAIVVICDHDDVLGISAARKSLSCALWKASQSRKWVHYEWAPLSLEWPKIVVVHTVRGRAVARMGTRFSTMVLLSSTDGFEVQPHDLIELPIDEQDFLNAGLWCWEAPVLRGALAWQAALGAFVLVPTRGRAILQLIEANAVEESWLAHVEQSFEHELATGHDMLKSAHENFYSLLGTLVTGADGKANDANRWRDFLGQWPQPSSSGVPPAEKVPRYVQEFLSDPNIAISFAMEVVAWAVQTSAAQLGTNEPLTPSH